MVTLSAGIAQTPEHGISATELLQAADEALYAAKQTGGDRIVVCQTAHPL
jgi:GGDEF domain-containing protein